MNAQSAENEVMSAATPAGWRIEKRQAFAAAEYRLRLDAVRERMAERGLDTLIVSTPENICYLSGFDTPGYYFPQALIVGMGQEPLLVVRALEARTVDARSWLPGDRCRTYQDSDEPYAAIADAACEAGAGRGRVGVDLRAWYLTVDGFDRLRQGLAGACIVDGFGVVEAGRAVKSDAELACVRRACAISRAGMQAAVDVCRRAEPTEAEVAAEVHRTVVAMGSEYPGLPLFLSSGPRTLVPHATWSGRRIRRGDNVFVELTGVVERYAGPLFRTLLLGRPDARVADRARVAEDMLAAVIDAIRPGATSGDVNAAATRAARRLGGGVIKRAGYSIGLNYPPDWGEGAFLDLKAGDPTVLLPGMVFHVPQTVRMPGEMPVAISETVLVTATGSEVLTDFPRSLVLVE